MTKATTRSVPSGLPPTEEELVEWQGLSRDEQLARTREVLLASEAGRVSKATMAEVLIEARRRVAARRG